MIEFCPHSLVSFKTESAKVGEWRLAELHVGDESRECRVQVTVNEVQGMADPCFLTSFDTVKPRPRHLPSSLRRVQPGGRV